MTRHETFDPAFDPILGAEFLSEEEQKLRRKLLMRLLRGFDFDAPQHRYEGITSTGWGAMDQSQPSSSAQ